MTITRSLAASFKPPEGDEVQCFFVLLTQNAKKMTEALNGRT